MDDVAACTNVLYEIAEAMDAADAATLRELLADASLVDGASGVVLALGGDAAVAHFASIVKVHGDGTWRTKHVTTNPIVAVDGDAATIRSMYTVFQQTDTLPLQAIIAGRYHDTFARLEGRWRLTERRYFADLIGDLSDHLTIPLERRDPTDGGDA
ncbi:MAG: nuclear transport factor 2 family protein [Actinomycetota bacterium]